MRERRAYYKRHMHNNNNNNNNNNESNELLNAALRFAADEPSLGRGEHLPFWDAYDVVNQLYLELGKTL